MSPFVPSNIKTTLSHTLMITFYRLSRLGQLLAIGLLLWFNLRLYLPRPSAYRLDQVGPDVVAQLRWLEGALAEGAGEEMQQYFPEGYFFTHALYGLAWAEVGQREQVGSDLHTQALTEVRQALRAVDSPAGRAPFSPSLTPPYGVFYVGWSSWLRGGLLMLQPSSAWEPDEVARFQADCAALAAAFDASQTPFLSAYPGQAWPVDNVVAVAALRLHDTLFPPRYTATLDRWVQAAHARLDPATGLLPHTANPATGAPTSPARATSQSLIARFLPEVDPLWGHQQYLTYRQEFVTTVGGVPGVREYPRGVNGGGDVDSGPLIAGISLSATAVTLGAAQRHGDDTLANPLRHAGEFLGLPVTWGGEKWYGLGLMPVGDAFLVWAKTARPWIAPPPAEAGNLPPIVPFWWRLPLHLPSLLLLGVLLWPFRSANARLTE